MDLTDMVLDMKLTETRGAAPQSPMTFQFPKLVARSRSYASPKTACAEKAPRKVEEKRIQVKRPNRDFRHKWIDALGSSTLTEILAKSRLNSPLQ